MEKLILYLNFDVRGTMGGTIQWSTEGQMLAEAKGDISTEAEVRGQPNIFWEYVKFQILIIKCSSEK